MTYKDQLKRAILDIIVEEGLLVQEKKSITDVPVKKGAMRDALNVPEGKTINQHFFGDAKKATEALVKAVGKEDAAGKIAFAANISNSKDADSKFFDKMQKELKNITEESTSKLYNVVAKRNGKNETFNKEPLSDNDADELVSNLIKARIPSVDIKSIDKTSIVEEEATIIDTVTDTIGMWYPAVIENNDYSGMSEEEEEQLNSWLDNIYKMHPDARPVFDYDDNSYFGRDSVTGLRGDVVDVTINFFSDKVLEESTQNYIIDGGEWGMYSARTDEEQSEIDRAAAEINKVLSDAYQTFSGTREDFYTDYSDSDVFIKYSHLGANDTEGREILWKILQKLDFKSDADIEEENEAIARELEEKEAQKAIDPDVVLHAENFWYGSGEDRNEAIALAELVKEKPELGLQLGYDPLIMKNHFDAIMTLLKDGVFDSYGLVQENKLAEIQAELVSEIEDMVYDAGEKTNKYAKDIKAFADSLYVTGNYEEFMNGGTETRLKLAQTDANEKLRTFFNEAYVTEDGFDYNFDGQDEFADDDLDGFNDLKKYEIVRVINEHGTDFITSLLGATIDDGIAVNYQPTYGPDVAANLIGSALDKVGLESDGSVVNDLGLETFNFIHPSGGRAEFTPVSPGAAELYLY